MVEALFSVLWHSVSFINLQTLGILLFGIYFYRLIKICYNYSIGRILFSKRKNLKYSGEWAIVTGATDGIGKAYAEELANDGLNIMLISRNLEKLKNVADKIESFYHVKTRIVVADFTQNNIYESIGKEIAELSSIACLVNNVGMSYPYFENYADAKFMNINFIQDLIACNTQSVATMTYLVLPKLLKQKKNNSAIINIGSFLGCLPSPCNSLYGSTKAFIHHFSKSIAAELNPPGNKVIIQTVCPLFVATAMSRASKTSFFIPSPRDYAKSALNMLGVEEFTTGCFAHALQSYVLTSLPLSWVYDKYKKIAAKARRKYQ
ncbi:steroid dehydrogenase, putative [Schistosoma mansoni]|uniref:steroid dehydrogenase, putative n=1 Tax=Schistosoma mansoni TaxID=6183 RepID=UPI00022C8535|nr:steroid dehydrogenase, putative [Schistosoma mansoni]|eukprot:XP_018647445.1 steroid dehydrogenase, putative [Schistosoma mansoni]